MHNILEYKIIIPIMDYNGYSTRLAKIKFLMFHPLADGTSLEPS